MFGTEFQDAELQGILHDLTAVLITSQEATHLPSALTNWTSRHSCLLQRPGMGWLVSLCQGLAGHGSLFFKKSLRVTLSALAEKGRLGLMAEGRWLFPQQPWQETDADANEGAYF